MEILLEDRDIVVIAKPAGMASQETPGGNDCVTALREHTGGEVYPVHRLDTGARGVMVYAKTKPAAAFLSKEIAEGRFHKEYAALVHGAPVPAEGTMEDWLFKDRSNKTFVVKRERRGVKKALLDYRMETTFETAKYGTLSLVRVTLRTGRTHQIRVQFASRGWPLLGDGKYGAKDNAPLLGLASVHLAFRHPATGEEMTFKLEADPFAEGIENRAECGERRVECGERSAERHRSVMDFVP